MVLGLAAAKLLVHLLTANRYGVFRDEMYGLACKLTHDVSIPQLMCRQDPVLGGEKWVATKWMRERRFISASAAGSEGMR